MDRALFRQAIGKFLGGLQGPPGHADYMRRVKFRLIPHLW